MNTSEQSKELTKDDFDDARINQLIARYSHVRKLCEEADDEFKTNKIYGNNDHSRKQLICTSTSTSSGFCPRVVQDFSAKKDDYIYKIQSDNDSCKGKNDSDYKIRIICDNQCYDNVDSPTNTSILSFPKLCLTCSNHTALRLKNRVSFSDHHKCVDQQTSLTCKDMPFRKSYAEKTTYCRPVRKDPDRYLLHKMIEKNAKLQLLLTKFISDHHKEKEREHWYNYKNRLKIKNRCYRDISTHFSSPPKLDQNTKRLLIKDYNEGIKLLGQSDSYREMLHDLYSTKNEIPHEYLIENDDVNYYNINMSRGVYNNPVHCFPSTSRCRITARKRHSPDVRLPRTKEGATMVDSDKTCLVNKATEMDENIDVEQPNIALRPKVSRNQIVSATDVQQNRDAQTLITFEGYNDCPTNFKLEHGRELEPNISEIDHISQVTTPICNTVINGKNDWENAAQVREKQESFYELNEKKESSKLISKEKMLIQDLHSKVDTLICIFNAFVADFKAKETLNRFESRERFVMTDTDAYPLADEEHQRDASISTKNNKKVAIVGNAMTNTSLSTIDSRLTTSQQLLNTRINKILHEELDKSNKLRSEIAAMLSPSVNRYVIDTVQIDADIPTRERSTEVTASLSKAELNESQKVTTIQDISSPLDCRMSGARQSMNAEEVAYERSRRIAVNTDPLGLLTLLNFSTEAVKQLLSLVPRVNSWYVNAFRAEPATADYVCNICGAAFERPSQLSAHILGHDLGQTRDCCACRHAVDGQRPSQLFRCRYCGQRFTRAYCCELHQQTCARRFGRTHDVSPGLSMLR